MAYQMAKFLHSMILTELEDAVGKENCSIRQIDKVSHSVDYYWLSRMWVDRGERMPEADFIVCPKDAQETSKVLKIANYYKIPVTTWGAGLVGQLVARLAKIAGALNVFVTDVSDNRLGLLPDEAGFHKINTTKENVVDVLKSCGKKELARFVFETTSVPSLIETEIKCLQRRGFLIITSSPKGKSTVDFEYCSRNGITIICAHNWAIHTPIATPYDPWTRSADTTYFLDLLAQKAICLENTITHKENYKRAIDMYSMLVKDRTQALGVLLIWDD